MTMTRRDFSWLLPILAATPAIADEKDALPSGTFAFEDLTVSANGPNSKRDVFDGVTHSGFPVDLHITELAPGQEPHPPHRHVHEEMIMIREGTLEVTIGEQRTTLGPGSVAYVASNDEHGWHNVGSGRAQYFVLALGRLG